MPEEIILETRESVESAVPLHAKMNDHLVVLRYIAERGMVRTRWR